MTNDELQVHLKSGKPIHYPVSNELEMLKYISNRMPAPHITCADGFTLSVQASATHYCSPRDNEGPYTSVEVWGCGCPEGWEDYGDGDDPYSQIPVQMVLDLVAKHGGVK